MENNWYQTQNTPWQNSPADPGEAAPKKKKKPRRTWVIWTVAAVAVVALIAGSSILFASRSAPAVPQPPAPGPDNEPEAEDNWDEFKSFRDYLEYYFTPPEEKAVSDIARVETLPGGELTLAAEGDELSLQEIYKRCAPSVVGIRAYVDMDSDDDYFWGTGIVMTEDGVIVTNAHLLTDSSHTPCRARVVLYDDTEYDALLIGFDSRSDIALLKIEAEGLIPAEFCDLASMEVGDSVVVIGNPLREEFRNSMTEGIISGIDRDVTNNGASKTLIQTTAPINEGNSGGPLLNRSGQVIGITNMKMSASYYGSVTIEGVGFAIPATTVKTVADSLLKNGEVLGRPALGITVGSVPDRARKEYGVPEGLYISGVSKGSDCEAKGIRSGDVITAVNGESVTKSQQILDLIAASKVGDTMTLTIWRQEKNGSRSFDVTVTLVEMNTVF